MITLFQPPPAWGLPNISPFCVKLETYLRMAKIEYKTAPGNPRIAPKGKIPYAEIDGQILGDSSLIILKLKKKFGDSLDNDLTPRDKAFALAIQRLCEDHLYFSAAWLRWSDEESWNFVRKFFLKLMPPLIGGLIIKKLHKDFIKNIYFQGTGRHSRDEIIEFIKEDLNALSVLLGENQFFLGAKATSIDATVYGFLVQQLWIPWSSPTKTHIQNLKNLKEFCERMKNLYW